jgi:hypothetical protein
LDIFPDFKLAKKLTLLVVCVLKMGIAWLPQGGRVMNVGEMQQAYN